MPGNLRRHFVAIAQKLLGPGSKKSPEQLQTLDHVLERISSKFQDFRLHPVLPSIGEISEMSGNVTGTITNKIRELPHELNSLPGLMHNITERLNTLPFLYELSQNLTSTFDDMSSNITKTLAAQVERDQHVYRSIRG